MKKMVVIWIIMSVTLVGALTFVGLQFQEDIKPYRSFESDLIESAQIYVEVNDIKLSNSESLKLDIEELITEKLLTSNEVNEDICEGHVIIKKNYKELEYFPYIKCEEYTTTDYE